MCTDWLFNMVYSMVISISRIVKHSDMSTDISSNGSVWSENDVKVAISYANIEINH